MEAHLSQSRLIIITHAWRHIYHCSLIKLESSMNYTFRSVHVLLEVVQRLGLAHAPGLVVPHPVEADSAGEVLVDSQVDVLPGPDVDPDKVVGPRHHLGLEVGRPQLLGRGPELRDDSLLDIVHQGLDISLRLLLITRATAPHHYQSLVEVNQAIF